MYIEPEIFLLKRNEANIVNNIFWKYFDIICKQDQI